MITGNNGILIRASDVSIMTEFAKYKEELELYKTSKTMENMSFYSESLTAGKNLLNYNTKVEQGGNIKTIIPDIDDKYIDDFEVIKGELLFSSQDKKLLRVAQDSKIEINPYNIKNGELESSDSNLALMDSQGTLTLPDTITSIGEGAFANTPGLKTVIIPYTVKEIKKNAFAYNSNIEKVIFQTKENSDGTIEGCETIGESAFSYCTNLKIVELPESLTNIVTKAFSNSGLEKIDIPKNITIINDNVFEFCKNLQEVNFLGDKIIALSYEAFWDAPITSIKIPKNIKYINPYTFYGCEQLDKIEIEPENKIFKYNDGILSDEKNKEIKFISTKYYKTKDTLEIPEGIIKSTVDINPLTIKNLIIPSSLTAISEGGQLPISIEKNNSR